jgi:hypothetical protein
MCIEVAHSPVRYVRVRSKIGDKAANRAH